MWSYKDNSHCKGNHIPLFPQEGCEQPLYSIFYPIDEFNDKVNKSCIILVRVLDDTRGDIRTGFLDMPVVNVGTALNLFRALKDSLEKHNFPKAVAFMSDTTNVMKGARHAQGFRSSSKKKALHCMT